MMIKKAAVKFFWLIPLMAIFMVGFLGFSSQAKAQVVYPLSSGCVRWYPLVTQISPNPNNPTVAPGGSIDFDFKIQNRNTHSNGDNFWSQNYCQEDYFVTVVISTSTSFSGDMYPVTYSTFGSDESFKVDNRYKKFKMSSTFPYLNLPNTFSDSSANATGTAKVNIKGATVVNNMAVPGTFNAKIQIDINPKDTPAQKYYVKMLVETMDYHYDHTKGTFGTNNINWPSGLAAFTVGGAPLTYTINSTAGPGGTISPSGNVTVYGHDNKSFTITPNSNYEIEDVKVDGVSKGGVGTYTFTNVTANHTINATFRALPMLLTVDKNGAGLGVVSSNLSGINCGLDCNESYLYNTNVTLTASPDSGSVFLNWTGACSGSNPVCSINMTTTKNVTATFDIPSVNLNVQKTGTGNDYGTVVSNPAGISCGNNCAQSFLLNTSVMLNASVMPGASFNGWGDACSGNDSTCTVIMDGIKNVTADFTAPIPLPDPDDSTPPTTANAGREVKIIVSWEEGNAVNKLTEFITYLSKFTST